MFELLAYVRFNFGWIVENKYLIKAKSAYWQKYIKKYCFLLTNLDLLTIRLGVRFKLMN